MLVSDGGELAGRGSGQAGEPEGQRAADRQVLCGNTSTTAALEFDTISDCLDPHAAASSVPGGGDVAAAKF